MIRRLSIYETKSRFYFIGSDGPGEHSVLKIDRTEKGKLDFSLSSHTYNSKELNELLYTIHGGNVDIQAEKKKGQANESGMSERHRNSFGLIGFVRFLRSYYALVVTRASKVAQLGYHGLYKVEDVSMIEIDANSSDRSSAQATEEQKYVKAFQSVDLSTHFYFAYSYDLTRTLQENLTAEPNQFLDLKEQFVWNKHLMSKALSEGLPRKWFLPLIHGFVGQSSLNLPAVKLSLILIGRRSNKYAGTRFLKRGANLSGYVGNEVETEQILCPESGPLRAEEGARYTSFVQHRGSVPLVWSQDPANRPPVVTGKPPPISLDLREPWAEIPALHFRDLLSRYGAPIVAVNLCKRRERRPHETLLNDHYARSVAYLNQFLPPQRRLLYVGFDMARCNKAGNVLPKLEEIAYRSLRRIAWFQTFAPLYANTHVRPSPLAQDIPHQSAKNGEWRIQSGVTRTNCVDCLDRTNVAQLVIGKVALAYQLYALGLLGEPVLPSEAEVCRVLENLFEEHGDAMALQYAGSHLVHSLKTYQKISALQERSRDVIQTLSRYYSNTFSDYDKQSAINLFLGLYRPGEMGGMSLWELSTDVHLHNAGLRPSLDYCEWFLPDPRRSLGVFAFCSEKARVVEEELDDFELYYRTYQLSSIADVITMRLGEWKRLRLDGPKVQSSRPALRKREWWRRSWTTLSCTTGRISSAPLRM